jgi:hypothetical protein
MDPSEAQLSSHKWKHSHLGGRNTSLSVAVVQGKALNLLAGHRSCQIEIRLRSNFLHYAAVCRLPSPIFAPNYISTL